jgi:hypothetical protein
MRRIESSLEKTLMLRYEDVRRASLCVHILKIGSNYLTSKVLSRTSLQESSRDIWIISLGCGSG